MNDVNPLVANCILAIFMKNEFFGGKRLMMTEPARQHNFQHNFHTCCSWLYPTFIYTLLISAREYCDPLCLFVCWCVCVFDNMCWHKRPYILSVLSKLYSYYKVLGLVRIPCLTALIRAPKGNVRHFESRRRTLIIEYCEELVFPHLPHFNIIFNYIN